MPFDYPPSPHTIVISPPRHRSPSSNVQNLGLGKFLPPLPHLSSHSTCILFDDDKSFPHTTGHQSQTPLPAVALALANELETYKGDTLHQAADQSPSLQTLVMTSPTAARRSPFNPSPTSTMSSWKMAPEPAHARIPFTHSPTRPVFVSSPNESPRSYQKPLPPVHRRQSRFDPMGREEDVEDEGYGELGHHHPLRRVVEEGSKEPSSETVSLPGIKSLLGGRDVPPTPITGPLFASPSLPSLIPASPSSSSATTVRTSRYSSFNSTYSASSETLQVSVPQGWWAPEFDRGSVSSSSSSLPPSSYRANSVPNHSYTDEHTGKRRRSDGPPALRNAEESARLRWQAQGRVASYPTVGQPPLRDLLHPPPAASASMLRQSLSGQSSRGTPLMPFNKDGEYPLERRIAPVPSRNASIVGGQLAASFADLSASEREQRSPLPFGHGSANSDMAPPMVVPERRPSALHLAFDAAPSAPSPRHPLPLSSTSQPPSTGPESSRRQSVTRPPSPDMQERPILRRRSSLTEAIIAKSGDNVAIPSGRYIKRFGSPTKAGGASDRLEHVQPGSATGPPPLITGWPVRRLSSESATPVAPSPAPHMPDSEGSVPALRGNARSKSRGKKRGVAPGDDEDIEMNGDPAMRGMEVLAESARRVSEAGTKDTDEPPVPPTGPARSAGLSPSAPVDAASPAPSGITGPVASAGGGPKYVCSHCAKTFSRPSSLRIHTYSHTGERPFVCPKPNCQRRFSVQSNLKRHAKVHQAESSGNNGSGSFGSATTLPNGQSVHPRPVERSHRQPIQPPAGSVYLHPPPLGFSNANGHHPQNTTATFQAPFAPGARQQQGQALGGDQQGTSNKKSPSGPWRTQSPALGFEEGSGASEEEGEDVEGDEEDGEDEELEMDELEE